MISDLGSPIRGRLSFSERRMLGSLGVFVQSVVVLSAPSWIGRSREALANPLEPRQRLVPPNAQPDGGLGHKYFPSLASG